MNIIIRWLVGTPSNHTIERPSRYPHTFSTGLYRGDVTLNLDGTCSDAMGSTGEWRSTSLDIVPRDPSRPLRSNT